MKKKASGRRTRRTHNPRHPAHPYPATGLSPPSACRRPRWRHRPAAATMEKKKGRFLFNETALAKVFRARLLAALNHAAMPIPTGVPARWIVDCTRVGTGQPALEYLSRYLYRGVISEHNILANHARSVTFRYIESRTGQTQTRTLKGEDFVWLVVQHGLPKGFRRVRDFGFLPGNAKKRLRLVQWVLHVMLTSRPPRPRPVFKCPACHSPDLRRLAATAMALWITGSALTTPPFTLTSESPTRMTQRRRFQSLACRLRRPLALEKLLVRFRRLLPHSPKKIAAYIKHSRVSRARPITG